MKKAKSFFTKKRIIWTIVTAVVFLTVWFFFFHKGAVTNIQTGLAKRQDIQKTVLTTGQVVSSTDLDLSFQASGVVRKINVKEGDNVKAGQVLATLDQGSALAQLESAQGSLAQAQANYSKLISAATSQDIAVSQSAVDSAQTTLDNAKQDLLNELSLAYNSANTVVLSDTNLLFSNPQSPNPQFGVSGTVQTNSQLVNKVNSERVSINSILLNWQVEVSSISESNINQVISDSLINLNAVATYLNDIISLLSTYTQVTGGGSQTTLSTYQSSVTSGKTSVDTIYSSVLSDNQAVKSATSALAQAKASLALKQAPTRPEDVSIAEAQVLSAQGTMHTAQANLSNTIIVAPTDGTITQIDIKLGEQATASKEVIKLLNIGELHTEADISEADIASVSLGQTIDNTFDALGPDRHFMSKVLTVNPASTVISGVVNYKITGSLQNIPDIKPGMTVNMTILVSAKKDALVVPSSSIINQNNKKFIRIIDDPKTKTYHQVEVSSGLEADGGLVEILSGVNTGQEVVTYIK